MSVETAPRQALSEPQVRIIRAAYGLVSEHGVHRVSLERIAAAAGVSKGLVLYHFRSRDGLLLAMMRWILEVVAQRIHTAAGRVETPTAKVAAMLDVIFTGAEANRRFYLTYLEIIEHAARLARYGPLTDVLGSVQDQTYAEVVQAGIEAGQFRAADVREMAAAVRGLVEGLFLQWLQEPDWRAAHPRYRRLARQAVLAHLTGDREPARGSHASACRATDRSAQHPDGGVGRWRQ